MAADSYSPTQPERNELSSLEGAAVLDFGTNWCGYCRAAEPLVERALADYPGVRHLKIEDGPGRALGRAYRVKLWPTLVFLRDGVELARIVRPTSTGSLAAALDRITG